MLISVRSVAPVLCISILEHILNNTQTHQDAHIHRVLYGKDTSSIDPRDFEVIQQLNHHLSVWIIRVSVPYLNTKQKQQRLSALYTDLV